MQDETTTPEVQPETVTESALEKAIDEAITEAPAPKLFWGVDIVWNPRASDDERAQAEVLVLPLIKGVTDSPEDHLPLCIESLTVKRLRD